MTSEYKIDIFQNEISGLRGLRMFAYLFILLFIATGMFHIIHAYQKQAGWANYLNAITPFCIAITVYFQVTGKWMYKEFLKVDNDHIQWTRSKLFGTTNISWTKVENVDFQYSSINFKLINGKTNRFDLMNISLDQIRELKEILRDSCLMKNINFITK